MYHKPNFGYTITMINMNKYVLFRDATRDIRSKGRILRFTRCVKPKINEVDDISKDKITQNV